MKTHGRAGYITWNDNETLVRGSAMGKGLKVKTRVKAGVISVNHNETLMADRPRKLVVS
jgi:hypothetical protein